MVAITSRPRTAEPTVNGVFTVVAAICLAGSAATVFAPAPAVTRLKALLPEPSPDRRRPAGSRRWRVPRPGRREREAERWRTATIELAEGFAAELAAGRPPEAALLRAASMFEGPVSTGLAPVLASLRFRGDIAKALEETALRPGAGGLRMLAACWRIGADRGGALTAVVDGLVTALRDQEACRAEIAAHLAGPRATVRLLAVLPLLGLAMAAMLGARPLTFLFGTLPGYACLAGAAGLDALGLWWTSRIVRAAEAGP